MPTLITMLHLCQITKKQYSEAQKHKIQTLFLTREGRLCIIDDKAVLRAFDRSGRIWTTYSVKKHVGTQSFTRKKQYGLR